MARKLNVLEYIGAKLTGAGTARAGIFACRYIGSAYADPSTPAVIDVNEWWELTEDNPVGNPNSYFFQWIPKGKYRLQLKDDSGGSPVYTTIGHKENIHHSTLDFDNHINDDDTDMRHETNAIAIPATDQARLNTDLKLALDEIAGATWSRASDDSLKTHLDNTTDAHSASGITCTVGVFTDVESALDDHEVRITALETGNAVTPSGIHDFLGDMGVDVLWTAQDVNGIEYKTRHLWKHTGESLPATYSDLAHETRQLTPLSEIPYYSRRFDLTSSINTNLVLYYAIGAKGRADSSFTWSTVQSIEVEIPTYTQEFSGVLNGLSVCTSGGGSSSVYALDSIDIGDSENFPTATESGGSPLTNYIRQIFQIHNVTITGIEFYSQSALSGDCTMKYKSTTTGTSGSFTVASSNKQGNISGLSLPITAGDELQLWTTDPKGISHWRTKIWFTRT